MAFLSIANAETQFSKTELRELIYKNEVDVVEQTMNDMQSEYLAGNIVENDIRRLNEVFVTTSPEIYNFIDAWLEEYPGSAHAHAAKSWAYFSAAWTARGNKYVRDTPRQAFGQFNHLINRSANHAEQAYDLDPFLVSGSDALFGLTHIVRTTISHEQLLREVMKNTPNKGSLRRALAVTHTGWGGSAEQAVGICEEYANEKSYAAQDAVDTCIIYAAREYHWKVLGDWALEKIKESDGSTLEYSRVWAAVYKLYAAPGILGEIDKYFDEDDNTDLVLARAFDNNFRGLPFEKQAVPRVLPRAYAHALSEIEHDPYNHGLIEILETNKVAVSVEGDTTHFEPVPNALDQAQLAILANRKLISRPYDPSLWMQVAEFVGNAETPDVVFTGDPYYINAIYYSDHDPIFVSSYLMRKFFEMDALSRIEEMGLQDGWPEFVDGLDHDAMMNCPYIRLYRLREDICEGAGEHVSGCVKLDGQANLFDRLVSETRSRGACEIERQYRMTDLTYSEMPLDLSLDGKPLLTFAPD